MHIKRLLRIILWSGIFCILLFPGKHTYDYPLIIYPNQSLYDSYAAQELSYTPIFLNVFLSCISYKKSGTYLIKARSNILSVLYQILNNKKYILKTHIRCGANNAQIAAQLENTIGITGSCDITAYEEGSFLADTYHYKFGTPCNQFLKNIHNYMKQYKKKLWKKYKHTTKLQTIEQAIIIASIIALEGEYNEYDKIVNVILNRLKANMRLQMDSTVLYIKPNKHISRFVNKTDKQIDSLYNTYKYKGLPPTPIGNACKTSLISALTATDSKPYLFFVSNEKGNGHHFTHSFTEHNKNVQQYRKSQIYLKNKPII